MAKCMWLTAWPESDRNAGWTGICFYEQAGMFVIYAMQNATVFSRILHKSIPI